jgi:hypothetical protein
MDQEGTFFGWWDLQHRKNGVNLCRNRFPYRQDPLVGKSFSLMNIHDTEDAASLHAQKGLTLK